MQTQRPQFSIIVTTHIRPKLLARALESLVLQNQADFEIIIVSDVLDFETVSIAKIYLRHNDSLILNPNLVGPAESRNIGIKMAIGDWVMFLDDDDAFSKNQLNEIASKINKNSGHVYYTNYLKIREDRELGQILDMRQFNIGLKSPENLLVANYIPNSCLIVNSYIAKQIKFDSRLPSHEDWDWLIQLGRVANFEYLDIDGPIIYENHQNSRNNDAIRKNTFVLDYLSIYRKWPCENNEINAARKSFLLSHGLPDSVTRLAIVD